LAGKVPVPAHSPPVRLGFASQGEAAVYRTHGRLAGCTRRSVCGPTGAGDVGGRAVDVERDRAAEAVTDRPTEERRQSAARDSVEIVGRGGAT
jgi:hypothetical protein